MAPYEVTVNTCQAQCPHPESVLMVSKCLYRLQNTPKHRPHQQSARIRKRHPSWAALGGGGDLGAFGPGKMQKQFEAGAYTRPLFSST
jgi:hypothetical protein